ncbi:MAG: DegT/DnrJ/EryC1/StrS family aminotransferase [Candidatus ainarchaeum sp.]|nr:DegT/DnrJ/EryC1/StrS family aminotransferase [Candidatus ainarchaeum sp.]
MEKPAIEGGTPARREFLKFGNPNIGQEEIDEVVDSLKAGEIAMGRKCLKFEEEFSKYTGAKFAVSLGSCTAALFLSMKAAGIGKGDEVVTTPMTFAATANTIIHAGAKPVFADIDAETWDISPEKIKKKISKKTKAIIPVDYAGLPCDFDEIREIAGQKKLFVIEDAAHAAGAEYKNKKIGSLSDMTCFSFYAVKNLAMGEGGAVTTDNEKWAKKISTLRMHGMDKPAWDRYSSAGYRPYRIVEAGYKANMTDLQAAIGLPQLKKLDLLNSQREKLAKIYEKELDIDGVILQKRKSDRKQVWHFFPILIETEKLRKTRNEFITAMQKENIGVSLHYTALHLEPFYRKTFGYMKNSFPNAEFVSSSVISLPLYPKMAEEDAESVCSAVKKLVEYYKK